MSDFSLKAVFGLDATGVKTELRSLRKNVNDFATDWRGVVAAIGGTAVFSSLVKGAADLASELKKSSLEIGINVEHLQALDSLALRNNESQETLRKALEKTRLSTQEAAEGNEKLQDAFRKLGVNLKEIERLPLEEKLEAIAHGMVGAKNQQAAYNAVADIFGAKVGPQLINSLTELGVDGFDAVAQKARDAGHVFNDSTIAGLESAMSAIEEFKKRATIAVGEVIVNFRSEEGLKLLLFQFMKIVGQFGGGIADAIYEAGELILAVVWGALKGTINYFRDGFLDAIGFVAEQFNSIIPQWLRDKGLTIDVKSIDDLKSAGASVADEITKAIANTSPSTFKKDIGDYWDTLIKDQQEIVDELNEVDFREDLEKMRHAGDHIENAAKTGAEAVSDAADDLSAAAEDVVHAAEQLSVAIGRTGADYSDQSTTALRGVLSRLQSQFDVLQQEDAMRPIAQARNPMFYVLQNEIANVERELADRFRVGSFAAAHGEDAARFAFGDALTDKALRDLKDSSSRTTTAVERIAAGLTNAGFIARG